MVTTNARMQCRRGTAAAWASANPVLALGEWGIVTGTSPMLVKLGDGATAWNSLPAPMPVLDIDELAVADPGEMTLTGSGSGVATLGLLDAVARTEDAIVGEYYNCALSDSWGTGQALTQNTMVLVPHRVQSGGVLDRLAIEVVTGAASNVLRMGIYAPNGTLANLALIAEATSGADTYPLDASVSSTARAAAISATLTKNGFYWFGIVLQGGTGASVRNFLRGASALCPQGTAVPTGTGALLSRVVTGVTGALPSSVSPTATANSAGPRILYRYSSLAA